MYHSWNELRYHSHESLIGITSCTPWVTHGIQLRTFIARKMPKSMHNMRPYIGKELRHLPEKDIPVTYKIIGYESHLLPLRSHQRGTLFLLHI